MVKCLKNISPDSVQSDRTCPANLGVRSCPVKKFICPVRLSLSLHCTTIMLCCTIFPADCHTNVDLSVKQKFSPYLCPIILC